jgi:hypothetical protein
LGRLVKELKYYEKELADNESRVQEMNDNVANGTHLEADVKRFGLVVEESRMIIPNTEKRLCDALNELSVAVRIFNDLMPQQSNNAWLLQATKLLNDQHQLDKDVVQIVTNVDDLADGENF